MINEVFTVSTIDIPDPETVDDFLEVKTCPMCRTVENSLQPGPKFAHDTRVCLSKHIILHYIINHNQNSTDKELRKYTIKCMKEINKRRVAVGKIAI